jgi:hypothetical protein
MGGFGKPTIGKTSQTIALNQFALVDKMYPLMQINKWQTCRC